MANTKRSFAVSSERQLRVEVLPSLYSSGVKAFKYEEATEKIQQSGRDLAEFIRMNSSQLFLEAFIEQLKKECPIGWREHE